MKLFDEELAKLASLLMTYGEVYPEENTGELRERVLQHLEDQTGSRDVKKYVINARNAGRKRIVPDDEIQVIKDCRAAGDSLSVIAAKTGYSIATIHRILNPCSR